MPNFIIEEVITDLVNNNTSLVAPLLKLQYFAELTGNNELLEFALSELNGYKKKENVPDYRTSAAIISVDFQFGEILHTDKELPVEMIDKEYRDIFRKFSLTESVSVLEQMEVPKEDRKESSQHLASNLPMIMIRLFQNAASTLYKNPYYKAEVVAVRLLTNRNIVTRALTAIRSRLLSFCIQIGKTFGYNIEIESFNKSNANNNEKIIHIMNTTINNQGDGNLINTGDQANIQATITIEKGNKEQLNQKLKELGIDSSDIEELNTIVDEEAPDHEKKQLGHRAIDWISKVSGKALKGIGSIAKEVSSSVLAHIIMQYFGIPPLH